MFKWDRNIMPELPEVQTVVNELKTSVTFQWIKSVDVLRESIVVNRIKEFRKNVRSRQIKAVQRIGKYIVFTLDDKLWMVAHLKMTGKFIVKNKNTTRHAHDRVVFQLGTNNKLIFNDSRCFGRIELTTDLHNLPGIKKLGWDPWDDNLTPENFKRKIEHRKIPIKTLLLDQTIISGIGNIYASEILFDSMLNPTTSAQVLTKKQISRLISSTRSILRSALKYNGTSISDYRRVDEKKGSFQNFLKVYGKSERLCPICESNIVKIRQSQRSTFYCPNCQQ